MSAVHGLHRILTVQPDKKLTDTVEGHLKPVLMMLLPRIMAFFLFFPMGGGT